MITMRQIARQASVSVATVSRALDPEKQFLVTEGTRRRILDLVQSQQYVPSGVARALSRRSADTIGMVTAFSTDVVKSPYYQRLITGIIQGVSPLRHDLKWLMIKDAEIQSCDLRSLLRRHMVDGIVFLTWRLFPHLVREIELDGRIPAVLINDYDSHVKASIVYCDNGPGIRQLASHLSSTGRRRIAMLRGPDYVTSHVSERYDLLAAAAKETSLYYDAGASATATRFDAEGGYEAMCTCIKVGSLADAYFCANDDVARGALRALKAHKIKVPEEVAVFGFDDSAMNELTEPALSSIDQPLEAMGRTAVDILAKLISGARHDAAQIKFESELIIRGSG